MSFFLIRNSRSFGELHKIFTMKPIFPEEQVTPTNVSHTQPSAEGQRDKRIWLLLQQEKLSMLLKNSIYNVSENKSLLDKEPDHDLNYNPVKNQLAVSKVFDSSRIDPETGLGYGFGYDHIIRDLKDKKLSEASQDRLRDLWMNLGFYSTDEVIKATGSVELGDSNKKIDRRLYSSKHKNAERPYKNIYNDFDPKSISQVTKEPEYFSHSTDDIQSTDDQNTGLKLAKQKYKDKFLEFSDDTLEKDINFKIESESQLYDENHSEELDEDFDKILDGNPLMDRYTLQRLNQKDSNLTRNSIKRAAFEAARRLKQRKNAIFKTFDERDYVKKTDMEYDLKMKYGPVPSFAEILAEAEEIIDSIPILKKASRGDDYKRNEHFEPRYLNKQVSTNDYAFSFMPRATEASFPGFITGKYPFRLEPSEMLRLDKIVKHADSIGYMPDTTDISRKVYSLMKKDPTHKHYLENHIRYWYDDVRKTQNEFGLEKEPKTIPAVPWEYLKIHRPKSIKVIKDKKAEFDEEGYVKSTGKRKSSRATAFIRPGTGKVTINNRSLIEYCPDLVSRDRIVRPLHVSKLSGCFDVKVEVHGGGFMGQNYAARQAIAKALIRLVPEASPVVCADGLLKRDPRQVERKKTSKYKARKSYTYVKR